MPGWAIALLGIACTCAGGMFTFILFEDRRITRLEERVHGLGLQMREIPKRHQDYPNDVAGK